MRRALLIGAAAFLTALVAAGAAFALLVRHPSSDVGGVGIEAKIPVGSWLTSGDATIRNTSRHFSMRVESAHPVESPGMEVTAVRVYLFPKQLPSLSLGTVPGWPPRDPGNRGNAQYQAYLRSIPTLPRQVTIPPGREAQLIFAMRSTARPGTTVRLRGVDLDFRRHWMKYRELVGYSATLHTVPAR